MIVSLITTVVIIVVDQLVKYWTVSQIPLKHTRTGIPGLFNWTHIHNQGAGWGMFQGRLIFFISITLLFIAYILYLIYKNRHLPIYIHMTYGLLLGGAIGNLIDRIRLGYVIDMIQLSFINFPVFNIADMSLTLSLMLLLCFTFWHPQGKDVI